MNLAVRVASLAALLAAACAATPMEAWYDTAPAPKSAPREAAAPAPAPAAPAAAAPAPAQAPAPPPVEAKMSPEVAERVNGLVDRCEAKDRAACLTLGDLWMGSGGVPRQPGKASGAYAAACRQGEARGCRELEKTFDADDTTPDNLTAVHLAFKSACNLRVWDGCIGLAMVYSEGLGVESRPQHAAELLRKACDGGSQRACHSLSSFIAVGYGVKRDEDEANALEEKACQKKYAAACVTYGVRLLAEQGPDGDAGPALDLFRAACKAGEQSGCLSQGLVFLHGIGVREDVKKALGLLRTSCDAGFGPACMYLGHALREGVDGPASQKKAFSRYARGCELRDGDSCFFAGVELHQLVPPTAGTADKETLQDPDYPRALVFYEKACTLHSGEGCRNLSYAYNYGVGGGMDYKKSDEYARKACRLGVGEPTCDDGRRKGTRRLPHRQ